MNTSVFLKVRDLVLALPNDPTMTHAFTAMARATYAGIALAAGLSLANLTQAAESLEIKPAHALPDYTKRLLAGDTDDRRFGNAFAAGDFNDDGKVDLAVHIHGPNPADRRFAMRIYL